MKDEPEITEIAQAASATRSFRPSGGNPADPRTSLAPPLSRLHGLELALDSLGQALIVLCSNGRMIYASSHAARILAEEDGLLQSGEIFRASLEDDDRRLSETLASLFHARPRAAAKQEIIIQRPSGKQAYKLRLNALREAGMDGGAPAGAMVIIHDLHTNYQAWYARLRKHFQLTPRECECTILLTDGYSMAEIAERMDISMQTLRQHLKHAFNKTGTHKQHELVGIVLQLLRKR